MDKLTPGGIIRLVRITKGDSQEDFAVLMDCTANHLSMVENDHRPVSAQMARKIVELDPNYTMDDLLKR